KQAVLPDYSKIFKQAVLPDYSKIFKSVVLPDYSKIFKHAVLPTYAEMFKGVVVPDYSKLTVRSAYPDYARLIESLASPQMTAMLSQVAFDTAVAVRDRKVAGSGGERHESVLAEVAEAKATLEGDLTALGDYFAATESADSTTTVGADLTLKWEGAEADEAVNLQDVYHVLTEQLLVLDAIKDEAGNGPSPLEVYTAVLNTLMMLTALAALLLTL
ncbi:MAG TPA: hypothetical protein VM433_14120, partial [Mycobacteriales bacterium]|nr:hypothetical protein [Mycobacteriales bacterium]